MKHPFTETILAILARHFGENAMAVFDASPLLQYLNLKTRSANRGSKARGAFANHYAVYVLVEDYIQKGYLSAEKRGRYSQYEGARFGDLLQRQRELPFGTKLQNHALNSRLNEEFAKYFPTTELRPILRDLQQQRYWINEKLLEISLYRDQEVVVINVAEAIIDIIDAYISTKRSAFESFLETSRQIAELPSQSATDAVTFVRAQLQPHVDARIFEIVSFAILKAHYREITIYWGWSTDDLRQDVLSLYKTGRTNANDGGIDFVMKPLGRFFQVTENIDSTKYFLDIDKTHHFPLTFVVKSEHDPSVIIQQLKEQAQRKYGVNQIVERYMNAVEEIINLPILMTIFEQVIAQNHLVDVMNEILLQSQLEFNFTNSPE